MKLLAALLLGGFSAVTAGQEPVSDQRIGQALDDFATVAGAWYLNQRCGFVVAAAATGFDSDVAEINVALAQDLKDTRVLFGIQAASRSVAESGKYASCGEDARTIVINRVAHAHEWAERIRSAKARGAQAN